MQKAYHELFLIIRPIGSYNKIRIIKTVQLTNLTNCVKTGQVRAEFCHLMKKKVTTTVSLASLLKVKHRLKMQDE